MYLEWVPGDLHVSGLTVEMADAAYYDLAPHFQTSLSALQPAVGAHSAMIIHQHGGKCVQVYTFICACKSYGFTSLLAS